MSILMTTYNIQTDVRVPAVQKLDFLPHARCQPLLDALANQQFGDIIHLQEVPIEGVNRLQQLQNHYHLIYRQHSNPHNLSIKKNDGLVILLRKDRFDLIPGSEIEVQDAGNPNISLIVRAIEKNSQKTLTIFNTHVRGGSPRDVGDRQVKSLMDRVNQVAQLGEGILGGGDFNGIVLEPRVGVLIQAGFVLDPSPSGTVTEPSNNRKIDHLFAKNLPFIQAGNQGILSNYAQSDHYPLFASIEFAAMPVSPQPAVPNTPYSHRQPQGSFREVVIRHFQNRRFQPLLDIILTKHATTKGFELAVKMDFENMLMGQVHVSSEIYRIMNDLATAFDRAKLERSAGVPAGKVPAGVAQQPQPAVIVAAPVPVPQPHVAPAAIIQKPQPAAILAAPVHVSQPNVAPAAAVKEPVIVAPPPQPHAVQQPVVVAPAPQPHVAPAAVQQPQLAVIGPTPAPAPVPKKMVTPESKKGWKLMISH